MHTGTTILGLIMFFACCLIARRDTTAWLALIPAFMLGLCVAGAPVIHQAMRALAK